MKTIVVIREESRDYRFVTTVVVGKVFRDIVAIVNAARDMQHLGECDDLPFHIAEDAFVAFPQYPVRTDWLFDHYIADWTVIVDCDECRIYVGRSADDGRDGSIAFGESSNQIKWEKL